MLFNASNACNARNTRKLYVIGTADVVAGVYSFKACKREAWVGYMFENKCTAGTTVA